VAVKKVEFEINLPDGLVESLHSLGQQAKEAFVMELLREHKLSQGKAAEVLGVDRWALIDLMAKHNVPALDMSEEELDEELAVWEKRRAK